MSLDPPAESAAQRALPSVSVVVRSYHRQESLLALLKALLRQDYPVFEVVVMEQSQWSSAERAPLDELARADARLRILYSAPLGVGGARNAGWKAARYEVVLTIDDDDIPIGDQFVRGHAENYRNPLVVGVTGRHVYSETEQCGYKSRWRARRYCLSYNALGYPHAFCRFDERVAPVAWVHGSNGSVRRDVIERVGGWDDLAVDHDEHAFFLALPRHLKPGEHLVFDPTMLLLRRKDLPGGAAVRWAGPHSTFISWHHYFHHLVRKHRPLRFWAFYPMSPLTSWTMAIRWIWVDAHMYSNSAAKFLATLQVLLLAPFWYMTELVNGDRRRKRSLPKHQQTAAAIAARLE